jgi:hypothetical protein
MLLVSNKKLWTAALPLIVLSLGCNRGPTMVQVRGKVLNKDGSPLKGGIRVVRFQPVEDLKTDGQRVASGEIGKDGSFELFTRRPGDGIMPGTYNVSFTVWKEQHDPVSLIQDKYTSPSTTPFKNVKVDQNRDDMNFEIEPKSETGGTPPVATEAPTQAQH